MTYRPPQPTPAAQRRDALAAEMGWWSWWDERATERESGPRWGLRSERSPASESIASIDAPRAEAPLRATAGAVSGASNHPNASSSGHAAVSAACAVGIDIL